MRKVIYLYVLTSIALMLSGCGFTTVRWSLKDYQFQKENLPYRELKIVAFVDGSYEKETIDTAVESVSDSMREEVGITLRIVHYVDNSWVSRSALRIVETMEQRLKDDKDWDVAIAFSFYTPLGFLWMKTVGFGGYAAMIEDVYRRYIIIKELSSYTLKHELYHCFVFTKGHSGDGILFPIATRLLPFTPIIPLGGQRPTQQVREEVLKNKWRDFSKIPVIPDKFRKDVPKVDWSSCVINPK